MCKKIPNILFCHHNSVITSYKHLLYFIIVYMAFVLHSIGEKHSGRCSKSSFEIEGEFIMKKLLMAVVLIFFLFFYGNAFSAITEYKFYPLDGKTNDTNNGSPGVQGDIHDLNHDNYYSWLVSGSLSANETITSASLTFTNIINWKVENHDLYVHLLNTPHTDTTPSGGTHQSYSSPADGNGAVWYIADTTYGDAFNSSNWSSANIVNSGNIELFHYDETTKFREENGTLIEDSNGTKRFPMVGSASNGVAKNITYYFTSAEVTKLNEYFNATDNTFGIGFDPDCHYFNDGIYLTLVTQKVNDQGVSHTPEPATLLLFGSGLVALAGIGRKHLKKQ